MIFLRMKKNVVKIIKTRNLSDNSFSEMSSNNKGIKKFSIRGITKGITLFSMAGHMSLEPKMRQIRQYKKGQFFLFGIKYANIKLLVT